MLASTAWATFTSGSTGAPRLLLRSDASWRDSFAPLGELLDLGADEAVYLPVSLLSSMTVSSIAHAAAIGAGIVLPGRHGVAAADLADATWAHITPLALEALVAALEAGAPSRLRAVQVGGAALPASLRARAEALGLRVVAYYGTAELSYLAVDADGTGLRPFPGVELRRGDRGALEARSPYLALEARDVDGARRWAPAADGWGAAGDAVVLDEDARGPRVRVLGRLDGAIQTAGATVLPEDVEAALADAPGVRALVAFGVPCPRIGELVALAVEPEAALPVDEAELRRFARSRLPRAHWPRRWYLAAPLPRTAAGKPARAELARRAAAGGLPPLTADRSSAAEPESSACPTAP